MAVLTRESLLRELTSGRIRVEPLEADQVGPASIDLTLADEIRVIETGVSAIPLQEDVDYLDYTAVRRLDDPYRLAPGETIHGITRERITLSDDLCGFLEGRSRFARLGLMIHVTSAFVQPGVSNRQVLEICNVAGHPLDIFAGVRLCQLVVMRAEGKARYEGRFASQEGLQLRAVVQRVRRAEVRVDDETVGRIGPGLLALVGAGVEDDVAAAAELARKLVELRIFRDDEGRMNRSLIESGGELLVVSQFTLHGDARKGRRPSFVRAAPGERAEPLVAALVEAARARGVTVATGRFGALMDVELVNDGPVTLLLDTERVF